jgi:hypothetical protein
MVMMLISGLLFVGAVVFYWMVSGPLGQLPTYEELKALEDSSKVN